MAPRPGWSWSKYREGIYQRPHWQENARRGNLVCEIERFPRLFEVFEDHDDQEGEETACGNGEDWDKRVEGLKRD